MKVISECQLLKIKDLALTLYHTFIFFKRKWQDKPNKIPIPHSLLTILKKFYSSYIVETSLQQ